MNFLTLAFLLCALLRSSAGALNFGAFAVDDVLEILIPTTKSANPKCRNDSVFYVEELKKLKLWATEMFDASSKFPTGILFGSAFDCGNFDECIEVKIPSQSGDGLSGKYCMAKFHINPPENIKNDDTFSSWDKILEYSKDRSRRTRNDFHFSYCIPSSCRHEDLESSLNQLTDMLNSLSDFRVDVTVDKKHCQTKTGFDFSAADITFMAVVGILAVIVLSATIYEWLMKLDDLKHLQLSGIAHKFLIAFSFWTNLKKLNKRSDDSDRLQCIHGLKVISMFLIIMGHRIMFGIGSPISNPNFVENVLLV